MSIQERVPNGSSVNRLWSDNKTELLALFQYQTDAEAFAIAKVAEDEQRGWSDSRYIVTCTYSGCIKVFGARVQQEARFPS